MRESVISPRVNFSTLRTECVVCPQGQRATIRHIMSLEIMRVPPRWGTTTRVPVRLPQVRKPRKWMLIISRVEGRGSKHAFLNLGREKWRRGLYPLLLIQWSGILLCGHFLISTGRSDGRLKCAAHSSKEGPTLVTDTKSTACG